MFYGRSFLYDSIPSETFGLYIMDIDTDAITRSMGSSSMEIYEQKIFRNPTPYFLGATASPKLSFPFSAYAEQEMDAESFSAVQRWLFSSKTYKRFAIDQPDMQGVYFNCILNEPQVTKVGGLIQGFSCNVVCDSPFALKYPQTTTYSYSASVIDVTEVYYNWSDNADAYLYPTSLVLTMNNEDGNFSITNLDDENRIMSFVDLSGNEVLTISPLFQTVSSSTGLKRLGNFNKKFLRLVPGRNRLRIQGNVDSIVMVNQFIAKKVSG